jgi:hypothetical protein
MRRSHGSVSETLVGHWPHEHQTLMLVSGVLSAEARVGERASDAALVRQ